MCRRACEDLITAEPERFANVFAAFKAARDRPMRVCFESSASSFTRADEGEIALVAEGFVTVGG